MTCIKYGMSFIGIDGHSCKHHSSACLHIYFCKSHFVYRSNILQDSLCTLHFALCTLLFTLCTLNFGTRHSSRMLKKRCEGLCIRAKFYVITFTNCRLSIAKGKSQLATFSHLAQIQTLGEWCTLEARCQSEGHALFYLYFNFLQFRMTY